MNELILGDLASKRESVQKSRNVTFESQDSIRAPGGRVLYVFWHASLDASVQLLTFLRLGDLFVMSVREKGELRRQLK